MVIISRLLNRQRQKSINITLNNKEFVVTGTVNMGYMGTYTDKNIDLIENIEKVRSWNIVKENLADDCSDNDIVEYLNTYFNEYIEKIDKNIKLINDTFLLRIFLEMSSSWAMFWDVNELVIEEYMPDMDDDDALENIYSQDEELDRLKQQCLETPNDGSVRKDDVEAILRKGFPMFNFDVFLHNINPEYLNLNDGGISFQCSDKFGKNILCGAYDALDDKLCFTDWHNF